MTESGGEPRVVHNEERERYEIWSGDSLAGFSAYRERDGRTILTHTEVDSAFAGRGLASTLTRATLDDLVRRQRRIVPVCPFVASYLRKTSQYDAHLEWPSDQDDE